MISKDRCSALLWRGLINSNLNKKELKIRLQRIYRKNFPIYAELIINPSCQNRCKHCIYSKNYSKNNKILTLGVWKKIVSNLYLKLGFRNFIFSGRTLNKVIIQTANYLKSNFKDVKIGIIADGPSIKANYSLLSKLNLDHLDISLDGLERSHDFQRNFEGSFRLTIRQIKRLTSKDGPLKLGNIKRISILSTLTQINKKQILPLIKYLNKRFNLKNFFITPVACYSGNPSASLKLPYKEILKFIIETIKCSSGLKDSFVSFNIYGDKLANYLNENLYEFRRLLKPKHNFFEYRKKSGDNEFYIAYYPEAINGCREFIVNSNGDIITGYAMALEKIPKENIFCNVLNIKNNRKELFESLTEKPAFEFYVKSLNDAKRPLMKSKSYFGGCKLSQSSIKS